MQKEKKLCRKKKNIVGIKALSGHCTHEQDPDGMKREQDNAEQEI